MGSAFRWSSSLRVFLCAAALLLSTVAVHAQGCVAAHTYQCSMDELVSGTTMTGGGGSLHALTVDVGYRVFNSNKYFIDKGNPAPERRS